MSSAHPTDPSSPAPTGPGNAPQAHSGKALVYTLGAIAVLALVGSGLLWQKLSTIQEALARQSQDASAQAMRRAPSPARPRNWPAKRMPG